MAVLFTNESNPFALKALVASGFGQIDLELKLVDIQSKQKNYIIVRYCYICLVR